MSATLHTNHGDIKLELFCDTRRATAQLARASASGYYDGTTFHRNIKGFMLQGGDPTGTGKGGESIWGGKFADEIHPDNTHSARGTLSMANAGPNTNGSQFFLTYGKAPHLDNNYAVFGKTIDGGTRSTRWSGSPSTRRTGRSPSARCSRSRSTPTRSPSR